MSVLNVERPDFMAEEDLRMFEDSVGKFFELVIQPMCDHQKPKSLAECTSSSWSECLWWCRCTAAHQSAPRCTAVAPATASMNCMKREVWKVLCEKYRW